MCISPVTNAAALSGMRPRRLIPGAVGPAGLSSAGAASGMFSTAAALTSARQRLLAHLAQSNQGQSHALPAAEDAPVNISAFWHVNGGRAWLDQNDVTVKDETGASENFQPVEHLKRHTTLAYDRSGDLKHCWPCGDGRDRRQVDPKVGTTIYRPPHTNSNWRVWRPFA